MGDSNAYPAPVDKALERIRNWYKINRDKIPQKQIYRIRMGYRNDIGAFLRLTNSYILIGGDYALNCCRNDDNLLSTKAINISIGGCRIVGYMCVGNKNGLLVPSTIYDTELRHLTEELPDSVEVKQLEERLSALGNVIACNDRVALVHPDLDKESEEIIRDTLQVEIIRHTIANNPLVGTHCVLNNHGGVVDGNLNLDTIEELSSLLNLRLVPGTVNHGDTNVGSGLITNDTVAYTGMRTTWQEMQSIETALSIPWPLRHYFDMSTRFSVAPLN